MVTIEVNGKRVTWPRAFAEIMIEAYKKGGVSVIIM
jgi:hypothetical protein